MVGGLSLEEKIKEFMERVNKDRAIPSSRNETILFSDNVRMGKWFQGIKSKLSKESEIYKQLSTNPIIKDEMDRYLEEKEKKPKDIILLTQEEKIKEFMERVNKDQPIPSDKNETILFSDNVRMGIWFQKTIKKKLSKESDIYKQLSTNPIIKDNMDKYLEEKA
jgi:hypothetical protein